MFAGVYDLIRQLKINILNIIFTFFNLLEKEFAFVLNIVFVSE